MRFNSIKFIEKCLLLELDYVIEPTCQSKLVKAEISSSKVLKIVKIKAGYPASKSLSFKIKMSECIIAPKSSKYSLRRYFFVLLL